MKILLVDVDGKIPNLALMKLSTFHKPWDDIELLKLNISYYPSRKHKKVVDVSGYDKVYVSTIFRGSLDCVEFVGESGIIYGGVGYSLNSELSLDIDELDCDYSIYPENNSSYGFLTRGCIRNCSFCVVPEKEGWIRKVADVCDIVRHDKVYFLDNNILALEGHEDILQELVDKKIKYQFKQGLDIRLLNDTNSRLLTQSRYIGDYTFAFDDLRFERQITRKLKLFRKYFTGAWRIRFFIYCNANHDITSDVMHRLNWCRDHDVLPYLMRDINCWGSSKQNVYTDLAAYCNQPSLWKKMTPNEFITKRFPKNSLRQETFLHSVLC